jgi:hypothetical protein
MRGASSHRSGELGLLRQEAALRLPEGVSLAKDDHKQDARRKAEDEMTSKKRPTTKKLKIKKETLRDLGPKGKGKEVKGGQRRTQSPTIVSGDPICCA